MELKDFIKNTLHDITVGIREGNNAIQQDNRSYVGAQPINIDFDINVSYEDNTTSGGSGKITVAGILSGGLNKEEKSVNSNYSRIKFKLEMYINSEKATPKTT